MTILLNRKLFSIIFIFFAVANVFAQTPAEELKHYQKKYKTKKIITLSRDITYNIALDKNDEFKISKSIKNIDFILYKQASVFSDGAIYFSKLISLDYLKAKTLYPEEKKYKEYKVNEEHYSTKDAQSSSIFYDDNKKTTFIYPKLTQGAKRVLDYRLNIEEERLLGSVYFQSYKPQEEMKLQVIVDDNIDFGFKTFNIDSFNVKYTKEEKKGKIYYTWKLKDVPEYKNDDYNSPDPSYFIPHIVLFIKGYTNKKGEQIELLSSVQGLYNWYKDLTKDVNKIDDPELKIVVDSLITGNESDLEKVQKIYSWVQDNIKYVAFEAGYGGFIPRQASDVYIKRFGDCKDMASIITEMLKIADLDARLTWIGTRDIPYTYEEVFTPSVDNHMIASFENKDGKIYFLDATSSYLPFGMVSEFIQGKQALIADGETYKLANVPITEAIKNLDYDSTFISIKENKIIGFGHKEINGYTKVKFSYFFPDKNEKEKKDYVKNAFEKGNNKFTVSKTKDFNFDERDKPSIIEYDFEISNYLSKADDELYINLHLNKYLKGNDFEDDRVLPYEVPYKYIHKQIVVLNIPEGHNVKLLPENKSNDFDGFSYEIKYEKINNTIKLSSTITVDTLLIEPDKFNDWNKFIKELSKKYSELVVLGVFDN